MPNFNQEPEEEGMLYKLLRQLRGDQTPEQLGEQIMQSPKIKVLNSMTEAAGAITDSIPSLPPAPPEQGPEELGDQLMKQSPMQMLLQGRGQAHARPLMGNVEQQMQAEAKGLMQDEARRNMPNQPRDPNKEKRQADMMKSFLANGGGPGFGLKKKPMSSIPSSQNPFAEPTASPEQQAQAAGAMMKSKIPKAPLAPEPVRDVQRMGKPLETQAPGWSGNPETMEYESRPSRELTQVAPPEPQGFAVPEMAESDFGTDQDLYDDPYASIEATPQDLPPDPMQDKLLGMIDQPNDSQSMADDRMSQRGLDNRLNEIGSQNADLGFMQLLMRNANQMGTLGGKVASSAPLDDSIQDMQARNVDAGNSFVKQSMTAKSDKDNRLKAMQFLMKHKQDGELRREGFDIQREGFRNASEDRNAILQATIGRDNNNYDLGKQRIAQKAQQDLADAQFKASKAQTDAELKRAELAIKDAEKKLAAIDKQTDNVRADKALGIQEKNVNSMIMDRAEERKLQAERDRKTGANLDPVKRKMLETLSAETAKSVSAMNNFEGFIKAFDSAPSESEKINYAMANLKTLQSMEGPDAINGSDEPRLTGYLNSVRPREILRSGGEVFGTQVPKFRADIQRRIDSIKTKIAENQKAIKKIQEEGSGTQIGNIPLGKVRIKFQGKTMLIPEARLEEALQDGAEVIK